MIVGLIGLHIVLLLIGGSTGVGGAGGDSSAEVKELKAALDKAEADRAKVSNMKASNI